MMELRLDVESGGQSLPSATAAKNKQSTSEQQDRDLIGRVARGDRDAFAVIYQRYSRRIGGYLWKMLRDHELVDEALNDTMMVVWEKAAEFNFRSRLSTWMLGIAHNKGLKLLAKRTRRQSTEGVEISPEMAIDYDSPERISSREDVVNSLLKALDHLSVEHRTVMELTFYEGLSYREVAEVLDCPVNTVKTRVFHARKQLTNYLTEQGLDTDLNEHLDVS